MDLDPALNPILFAAMFLAIWIGIGVLISHIGGWASLTGPYRASVGFSGERWKFQSAGMRYWTNYSGCLTVGASYEGLYVSILFLFRTGHPPLLIPWKEISACRKRLLGREIVELRLGRELSIPFRIIPRLADRLRAAAGSAWPEEASAPISR
jgi:hypothetical protein